MQKCCYLNAQKFGIELVGILGPANDLLLWKGDKAYFSSISSNYQSKMGRIALHYFFPTFFANFSFLILIILLSSIFLYYTLPLFRLHVTCVFCFGSIPHLIPNTWMDFLIGSHCVCGFLNKPVVLTLCFWVNEFYNEKESITHWWLKRGK